MFKVGLFLKSNAIKLIVQCNLTIHNAHEHITVESRFPKPPGETQIGSRNRRVREIGGKITVFDRREGTTFGSSYREVHVT